MTFDEVLNKVIYGEAKTYSNGYNTIRFGPDEYEVTITGSHGDSIVVILSDWEEGEKNETRI